MSNGPGTHSNHTRPQSMHVANTCPPRYGYLASFGWYWGPLTRAEATQRLRHKEDGCFLVRDSEGDMNKFTLSFKGAGQIFHNRILRHNSKYAFLPVRIILLLQFFLMKCRRFREYFYLCFSLNRDKWKLTILFLEEISKGKLQILKLLMSVFPKNVVKYMCLFISS